MPNLTIAPADSQRLQDLLNSINEVKPEPITFSDDPVAMAFASYRAWKENHTSRWVELGSVPVTEQDRVNAQELRAYYRRTMTWQTLKTGTGNASPFRRKLAAIVTDTYEYTKQDIGLLHRLPYFYHEDLALDRVFAATKDPEGIPSIRAYEVVDTLMPVERILRSRRAGEYIHFYWKNERGFPYLLVAKHDNPLISLIEGLFKQEKIKIQGIAFPKHARGYHHGRMFLQLANVELV